LNTNNIIKIEDFFDFPKVEVSDYIAKLVKNGVTLDERQTTIKGIFFVTNKCDIIAMYEEIDVNKYKPILIF
jgi:tRNA pseudouridine55 synthase